MEGIIKFVVAIEWALLESYKEDLLYAQAQGRNLLCEKYAYMMEQTAPAEYEAIKNALPVPSMEALYLADLICTVHVTWQEELAKRFPNLTGRGRPVRKEMDGPGVTSFETYLCGELLTYSVETLRLYVAFVEKNQKEKINLCEQVLRNTVLRYGYPDLETAEEHQAKRA